MAGWRLDPWPVKLDWCEGTVQSCFLDAMKKWVLPWKGIPPQTIRKPPPVSNTDIDDSFSSAHHTCCLPLLWTKVNCLTCQRLSDPLLHRLALMTSETLHTASQIVSVACSWGCPMHIMLRQAVTVLLCKAMNWLHHSELFRPKTLCSAVICNNSNSCWMTQWLIPSHQDTSLLYLPSCSHPRV